MSAFAPNAFAGALEDLFADSNIAQTAIYRVGGIGDGVPVRIIARQPDRDIEFGDISIHTATTVFEIMVSALPYPAEGDSITMDGETFIIQGEPKRDAERLIWRLGTRSA
jgi:hypothetical protein